MSPLEQHAKNLTSNQPAVDIGEGLADARANYDALLQHVNSHGTVYAENVSDARADLQRLLAHYGDAGISAILLESLKLSFPKE